MQAGVQAEKGPAGIFDYDGTILREDSALLLFRAVVRRYPAALLRLAPILAAAGGWAAGLARREAVKVAILGVLERVPPPAREKFLEEFHEQALVPRYLPAAQERLRWHRERGHRIVICSASVDLYLEHAARYLRVDRLVCTAAALDPRLRLLGPNCRGEEKVRRLSEIEGSLPIDWPESWAYSDSISDRPLLRQCGHPVAVNPGRALRREAARRGWTIQDW